MTDSPYRRQEGGRRNMPQARSGDTNSVREATNYRSFTQKRCYICNSANHLAHQCKAPITESTGKSQISSMVTAAKQVTTYNYGIGDDAVNPIDLLLSDPDNDGVFQVRITDRRYIEVQGVPVYGIADSAADITIMSGKLFRQVTSVARLQKKILNQQIRHHVLTTGSPSAYSL